MPTPHYPTVIVKAWQFQHPEPLIHSAVAKMKRQRIPCAERQAFLAATLGRDLAAVLAVAREWFTVRLTPGERWDMSRFRVNPDVVRAKVVLNMGARYPHVGVVPTLHTAACDKVVKIKNRRPYNASATAAFTSEKARRDAGSPPAIAFCTCIVTEVQHASA